MYCGYNMENLMPPATGYCWVVAVGMRVSVGRHGALVAVGEIVRVGMRVSVGIQGALVAVTGDYP